MKKTTILIGIGSATAALGQPQKQQDLSSLNIEDLMKIEVVSASKFAQTLRSVPAAIYVVTSEDIKRSGAQSIPDMLRLVPGVQVAQIDGNKWMVSVRGFNHRYANMLQVLVDGMSVYAPTFGGVYWDALNVPPDDIQRIEVIRGPGGAVWGANAVNGVINIITKHAAETQGGQLEIGHGRPLHATDRLRVGGVLGRDAYYRTYAEYMGLDNLANDEGVEPNDGWSALRGGFRIDKRSGDESLMISGHAEQSRLSHNSSVSSFSPPFRSFVPSTYTNSNYYLNGLWRRNQGSDKSSEVRASYVFDNRNEDDFATTRGTLDVEYRMSEMLRGGGSTIWGLSYRRADDSFETVEDRLEFDPASGVDTTYGGFFQLDRPLGKRLHITFGSTVEHNEYTGWELQPGVRLLWDKSDKEIYWASLARAVKTPTRAELHGDFSIAKFPTPGGLMEMALTGNPNLRSIDVTSFEVGARFQPNSRTSLDVTAFVNWYDNAISFEPQPPQFDPSPIPHTELDYQWGNKGNARTGGIEVSAQFLPRDDWRLGIGFALYTDKFWFDSDSNDQWTTHGIARMGTTPRYTIGLRSSHDLAPGLTLDLSGLFVDKLPAVDVPAHTQVDFRLGWQATRSFELSLSGRNLLGPSYLEGFSTGAEVVSKVGRSWRIQGTWRF